MDVKEIKRGKFDFFGVKIINVLDPNEFQLTTSVSGAYKIDNDPIISPDPKTLILLKPSTRTFNLDKNEDINLGIGVQVDESAQSGTYLIDVKIKYGSPPDYDYYADSVYQLYVTVP